MIVLGLLRSGACGARDVEFLKRKRCVCELMTTLFCGLGGNGMEWDVGMGWDGFCGCFFLVVALLTCSYFVGCHNSTGWSFIRPPRSSPKETGKRRGPGKMLV